MNALIHRLSRVVSLAAAFSVLSSLPLLAQGADPDSAIQPAIKTEETAGETPAAQPKTDKRIFGVLPNYRTAEDTGEYHPLTVKQKFHIGYKDSSDWPVLILSGAFAGLAQLRNEYPSFGQGMSGFGKRYVTAYTDQAIGNIISESALPSLLHEDPRYFRRAKGTKLSRTEYALSRILVTRTDSGGTRFNSSEVFGNTLATLASNAYYKDNRNLNDNIEKLLTQLATDATSNVLKEFWPDVKHRLFAKKELR